MPRWYSVLAKEKMLAVRVETVALESDCKFPYHNSVLTVLFQYNKGDQK